MSLPCITHSHVYGRGWPVPVYLARNGRVPAYPAARSSATMCGSPVRSHLGRVWVTFGSPGSSSGLPSGRAHVTFGVTSGQYDVGVSMTVGVARPSNTWLGEPTKTSWLCAAHHSAHHEHTAGNFHPPRCEPPEERDVSVVTATSGRDS